MVLESVSVKNFRSLLDETLVCESLTALVGANGCGKSAFLRALDYFYNPAAKVDKEDFYNRDVNLEIAISVTFTSLSSEAKELFQKYIQNDTLTVARVFSFNIEEDKIIAKYHGSTLQNPDFHEIKAQYNLKDKGQKMKESYSELRKGAKYSDLAPAATKDAILEQLVTWENAHTADCIRERDDGQFFGFQSVGQGYLGKFTKFLFIPAIKDAAEDANEAKGSAISILMDLVVRSVLTNKAELKKLREEAQSQYQTIMAPSNLGELTLLSENLTKTLKTFAPDASVDLFWQPLDQINIPMPQADVRLAEDGFSSVVSRTGHGLQRAFILTMLQHLALAQANSKDGQENGGASKIPNFIIAIEEPELYQHPNRQRHLANILLKLTSGEIPGVADNTQVLYCTHSPLFVGIDRIDQLRLLRKSFADAGKPKVTKITSTQLAVIAQELNSIYGNGGQFTVISLKSRLQSIMTPIMNEGFFSDVVALVEGEDDRAAILGVAKAMNYDFDALGVSVIVSGGKLSIDRPYLIFKKLNIPAYPIWDSDFGKKDPHPETNKNLLKLLGETEEEWPNYVKDTFACFHEDLENTLKNELGATIFDNCFDQCKTLFGITKVEHTKKNPNFYSKLIEDAKAQGVESPTLKAIVENIVKLKK